MAARFMVDETLSSDGRIAKSGTGRLAREQWYSIALVDTPTKSPAIMEVPGIIFNFDRNTDRTSRITVTHGRAARATKIARSVEVPDALADFVTVPRRCEKGDA